MSQPQRPDESTDESMASLRPTPVAAELLSQFGNLALQAIPLAVAGAGAILLVSAGTTSTMGATRSTRLKWEERKLQIEQADCDAHVDPKVDFKSNAQPDATE
jgi:hypothetical protein